MIKNYLIAIPGSKSYTNRALLLAALTEGKVTIKNPLFSDDTKAMIHCLQTLGIKIKVFKTKIDVIGSIENVKDKNYVLNANLSGTTIRFLLAFCTIIPGVQTLTGKEALQKRPIADLVDGLKQLGAKIEYIGKNGYPPLKILSSDLSSKTVSMSGKVSSQFFSAIMMISPIIGNITIHVLYTQISKPYIDMTIAIMKQFGVTIINNNYKNYVIRKQKYKQSEYTVEGDFSSAGYFFAIAALNKKTLKIKNLNSESKQADKKILGVLKKMGSKINFGKNEITISGNGIKAMTIDMTDFPDQAQTLAVLAAFANGTTKLTGVQSLRVKETERVVALQKELKKMSIRTTATKNTLTIYGGNPKPATIDTYGDHRMAMSFAVAKSKLPEIVINNPEVVNKTFPDFWKKL
jgi:3-phosphoshikimate 1-carboxyvinyltransferase